MPRIRFLVIAALTAASCLSLTGVASADSVVNNRWYSWPVAAPGQPNSDCSVQARLMYSDLGGIYAGGNVVCNSVKRATTVTTRLKWNGYVQGVPPVTTFTNSYGLGTRWLNTGRYGGCGNWQAVVTGTVIDSAGRSTTAQATTYAPVYACH